MEEMLDFISAAHPLGKDARDALRRISFTVEFKKNETVLPIGHIARVGYFLISGGMRIFYTKENTEITEKFVFENSWAISFESVFTGRPSRKGMQTLEDTYAVGVCTDQLKLLFEQYHEIDMAFRRMLECIHLALENRIENLQFYTAEERYQLLLQQQPDLFLRVPLKYIASYLGMTQVSLSRIRALR